MSRVGRQDVVVLDREYDGTTGTLRVARNDLLSCLKAQLIDDDVQERAQLVVSELATNAIQASPGSPFGLQVSVSEDGSVHLSVTSSTDTDGPPPRNAWGPVHPIAVRGRGLLIVGKLTDEVDISHPTPGTIVVTATFHATPTPHI
jgi:anti-sigma regulatory factor (Ser/Thr protein kinase)